MPQRPSGGVETDPGLVGQTSDLVGPSTAGSSRSMPGRRRADTTGTPPNDDFASGDLGAMDRHDRHHDHALVGQDLGGLVGLERHHPQGQGQGVAPASL
jgi:hypothetical protein